MKTFLKVLAGITALVVVAIVAVILLTAGMSDTADKFFTAVKSNDYDLAYTCLSDDFKSNTSKEELESYMKKNALSSYKEASWVSRSVNGKRGRLEGSIDTESGGAVPVSLSFVKGDGGWQIYAISKQGSGLQEESTSAEMPGETDQVKLVRDSMHVFALSVKEGSMEQLHGHVSGLWQSEMSVDQLNKSFESFFQFGDTLMVLDSHTPQFSSAATIDDNGVLLLKGLYPTEPSRVYFEHNYIYEGLKWKLVGLNVSIK